MTLLSFLSTQRPNVLKIDHSGFQVFIVCWATQLPWGHVPEAMAHMGGECCGPTFCDVVATDGQSKASEDTLFPKHGPGFDHHSHNVCL